MVSCSEMFSENWSNMSAVPLASYISSAPKSSFQLPSEMQLERILTNSDPSTCLNINYYSTYQPTITTCIPRWLSHLSKKWKLTSTSAFQPSRRAKFILTLSSFLRVFFNLLNIKTIFSLITIECIRIFSMDCFQLQSLIDNRRQYQNCITFFKAPCTYTGGHIEVRASKAKKVKDFSKHFFLFA